MPKCKSCMTEETRFETYEELDKHFEEVHPKPPPTPCPQGYEEAAAFMVDSMMPDWIKQPATNKERVAKKQVEDTLRAWNAEDVHSMLTKLIGAGYVVTRPLMPGGRD